MDVSAYLASPLCTIGTCSKSVGNVTHAEIRSKFSAACRSNVRALVLYVVCIISYHLSVALVTYVVIVFCNRDYFEVCDAA